MSTQIKRWGIATGVLSVIWLIGEYIIGLHGPLVKYHPLVSMFAAIIPIVCLPLGMKSVRNLELNGYANYTQLVRIGVFISAVSLIIAIVGQLLYNVIINPAYFEFMIQKTITQAKEANRDVAIAEKHARGNYNLTSYIFQLTVNVLAGGLIISAVAAYFLKKEVPKKI
nr:DUF4199 domain-containing protein [Bacteroidota bacterium]